MESARKRAESGYAFLRRINFDRAGEEFDADPASYVRFTFRAEF